MCGIAGVIGPLAEDKSAFGKMLRKQKHRGPDAMDTWYSKACSLGHNRLSILDLSVNANQPMVSQCGRYVLVFNGEIYNYLELKKQLDYKFRTNSDSEVLLALYIKHGEKMLSLLNGMFAFAIWDKKQNKLFAARDRFGVKPFYYAFVNESLVFASEIKSLIEYGIPNKPNDQVWADYLVNASYGAPEETFYKYISQLPGGFKLTFPMEERVPKISSYYNFVERVRNQKVYTSDEELKDAYFNLLMDSIELRFRADVPVGFNVSGGLDSSTLLALILKVKETELDQIEAFTFYTGDPKYDELPWVEDLINKTNSPLNRVLLEANEITDLIQKVSYFQDEPFGGIPTIAYSKIFERARAKGIKVLLDGQGMDEAWAGYDYYQSNSGAVIQGLKTNATRTEVLDQDFARLSRDKIYPAPFDNNMQNMQYRDLFYTKIPRALRFNDRVSMMHSTELREPFLDYRLVEMAFAQKPEMKIKNKQGKWYLRQIVRSFLGEIAYAPKRPLQTPQREWLGNELKDYVHESIQQLSSNPYFQSKGLERLWKDYLHGNRDNSFYVWQWISAAYFFNGRG